MSSRASRQVPKTSEHLNVPVILRTLRHIEHHVRSDISLEEFARALASAIATLVLLRAAAYQTLLEFEQVDIGKAVVRRRNRKRAARKLSAATTIADPGPATRGVPVAS